MFGKALLLAVGLDLVLGDPQWGGHPVRWVGRLAAALEPPCRRMSRLTPEVQGMVFLGGVLLGTLLPVGVLSLLLAFLPGGWIGHALLFYFALGGTALAREVRAVSRALGAGDLAEAQQRLALLTRRKGSALNSRGIAREALETLATAFGDAVCGTLLYGMLGGPVLAWLHRATNALNAAGGHSASLHGAFGKASHRFNDLLNLLPSRLGALGVAVASKASGGSFRQPLVTAWRDAPAWESPNEGWPMGAFAGALGISLGGPRAYGGVVAQKPFLGRGPAPEPGDLDRGLELYWRAFFVATLGALALGGLGL